MRMVGALLRLATGLQSIEGRGGVAAPVRGAAERGRTS